MRRLETISEKDPGLFATHPPTQVRSERLKDHLIYSQFGTTYRTTTGYDDYLGEYKGVSAYSNGPNTGSGDYQKYKWQCVDYIKRF